MQFTVKSVFTDPLSIKILDILLLLKLRIAVDEHTSCI